MECCNRLIVALFEDNCFENFLPLTYTKPVFELRSGMFTFLQRAERTFKDSRLLLFARDFFSPSLKRRFRHPVNEPNQIDDDVLLVNAALIVEDQTKRLIDKKLNTEVALSQADRLVLARLSEETAKKHEDIFLKPLNSTQLKRLLKECRVLRTKNLPLINYPWELIDKSSDLIKKDYTMLAKKETKGTIDRRASIYGEETSVHVGKESLVEAFVTLDTRNGPIYIGNETMVQSGSRISGPSYVGDNTIIASGLIREGCSIGFNCRIGGELEQTVVQGYTNKYHLGYIGHAYIGEWVNIGAATTNSNLKNTYGTVKVRVKGKLVDTGRTKVGCFIGDHVKTSIGTQIYTGIKIGVASQVHGFVTEDVPSFTAWAKSLGRENVELYLNSVIETQKRVFARRGVKQTREDVDLLKKLFDITTEERRKAGVVKKRFE